MTVPRPLLPHLRAQLPTMGRSDRKVGRAVLAQPGEVVFWSVGELAAEAGTAKSSVVRFCQGLGLRGFHDLKLVLAQETAIPHRDGAALRPASALGDGGEPAPTDVLGGVVASGVQALRDAAATVRRDAFDAAADLLAEAGTVVVVGSGASAPLAHDAAQRGRALGLRALAPADPAGQGVAAALLGDGDACLAISHAGATPGTLAAVTAAGQAGAATVALTSFARTPLTERVDHVLLAGARPASPAVEALTSRLAHVAVLDALLVAVALRRGERAEAALARAGAALGASEPRGLARLRPAS